MVAFDLWRQALIFGSVYFFIILISCLLTLFMGLKVINQLGRYPTRAPQILMRSCFPFICLVVMTFGLMLGFFHIIG